MEPNTGTKRTLVRDTALLQEFGDSDNPDLLVLYYHYNDRSFDCFNASEYNAQMLRYYANGMCVTLVVPRRIGKNEFFLVGLQNKQHPERDSLCEVAFQCQRQFVGISMLVKKKCFLCHKPTSLRCMGCQCACFCSKECQMNGWKEHKKLCKVICTTEPSPTVESECVDIEL